MRRDCSLQSVEGRRSLDVVGIATDAVYSSIREPVPPTMYLPQDALDVARPPLQRAAFSVR
jgi:hypothetical protein